MRRRVGPGACDDGGAVTDLVDGGRVEREPLVIGQCGRLARRPGDDEAVRAVVDQIAGELAKTVEIDRPVGLERRDDGGQYLAQHHPDCTPFTRRSQGSLLKEFRDFLLRGNLIELAVAFVMGLAFATVVNSLVNNLVMPIIAAIVGKPSFRELTFTIHKSVFQYGSFITDVIQFVAIGAAVFFFIVKPVQLVMARHDPRSRRPCATRSVGTRNCWQRFGRARRWSTGNSSPRDGGRLASPPTPTRFDVEGFRGSRERPAQLLGEKDESNLVEPVDRAREQTPTATGAASSGG